MQVLRATAAHVPDLARLRLALLEETGGPLAEPERQRMLKLNEAFFRDQLGSPLWQDWVAIGGEGGDGSNGRVCAIGAMAFLLRPPYPGNPEGKDAYLLNMYTAPGFRGQGAAGAILGAALADAQARGVRKIILHATEAGRRLYLKLGFLPSSAYMELVLQAP